MPDIVTFGEAMIRLTPPGMQRLEQAHAFDVWVAGAELNVAVGLARLGGSAGWVSRLPDNPLGRRVAAHARANGVDTAGVAWTEEGRLGLFFVEVGQAPRPSATLYDRGDSAFATLDPAAFDWADAARRRARVPHERHHARRCRTPASAPPRTRCGPRAPPAATPPTTSTSAGV